MKPEHESTSINDEATENSTGWLGALRSRYRSFTENYKEPEFPGDRAWLGRKVVNLVIFCALLIAILTVFGIGLDWFSGGSHKAADAQINQPASKSAPAETPSALPLTPAQPAGPAGHAEMKPQSAPPKKTDGK